MKEREKEEKTREEKRKKENKNRNGLFFAVEILQDPGAWSAEFNDFVEQCLTMDADKRPTAEQLLKHPFLKKAAERLTMPKVEKKKKEEDVAGDNDKLDAGDE